MTTQSGSLYRCAECGHGDKLIAWSEGLFEGPLGPDGLLTRHDWAEDTMVCESSIKCDDHGDCVTIHKRVDGRWCVQIPCAHCEYGRVPSGYRYGGTQTCSYCHGNYGQWTPIEEPASV